MYGAPLTRSHEKTEDSLGQSDDEASDDQQRHHLVADATLAIDPIHYHQYRADGQDGAQVTYRVVQVSQAAGDGEAIMTTASLPPGTQVAQAVIQSPFGTGAGSPRTDGMETRFAYVSAGGGDGDTASATAVLTNQVTPAQFYVMMSPQDVLQSQRNIAPRANHYSSGKGENPRAARDDRRRATHNEVERRRRDKINNWIVNLSKLVPDSMPDHIKQGPAGNAATSAQSKGGILAKACDYITDLRSANAKLSEGLKDAERAILDNEVLRQQLEDLKQENVLLRAQLQQHGLLPDIHHSS